jgi:cobalt-zinc-cadmium efflux system membrane fusion protein
MNKHQMIVVSVIAMLGLLLGFFILRDSGVVTMPNDIEEEGDEGFTRGPHGGRLLEAGNRSIEVTIFETGIPPELRIYPYIDGQPVDPASLDVTVELQRLGGVVDTLSFRPLGAFLQGDKEVYEPHSFGVVVRGTWMGEPIWWEYATIEGRVEMPVELAAANGVVVDAAATASIRETITFPGEVQLNADGVARVAPRVAGVVTSVSVALGQQVTAGTILAIIESTELGKAQGDYVESLHRMELAQSAYERERTLFERGITARKEYEQALHDLEEAELERQLTEHVLISLGVPRSQLVMLGVEPEGIAREREVRSPLPGSLTRYAIHSPIGGEVIERQLAVGQRLAGDEEVFRIADLSTVWVEVAINARDLGSVRAGQEVIVRSLEETTEEGTIATGRLSYVGSLVGEATRTARALVTLPNPGGQWRPGQFVEVEVVRSESTVSVAVRREAIQTWREMPVVFAQFGDAFEVRPLTLGRSGKEYVEVLEGLLPGQMYAVEGAFLLRADLEKSGASHDH